jgi:hypothetical protein
VNAKIATLLLPFVFVGKLFGEAKLLAVAKAYQDATSFHLRHPKWIE